ncbi:MAG: hypothetical protein AB1333_02915 [Patescibacteria group bacterium]
MKASELRAVVSLALYQIGKITSEEFKGHVEKLSTHELIILHSKLGEERLKVLFLLKDGDIGIEEKESEKYEDVNKIVEFVLLERMKSMSPEDFLPYFPIIQNIETCTCLSAGLADAIEGRPVKELIILFKKADFYLDATDIILEEFQEALKLVSREEVIESMEDDMQDMLERNYLDRLNLELPDLLPKEFERIVVACSNELVMRAYDEIVNKIYDFTFDSLIVFLNNAWKADKVEDAQKLIREVLIARAKDEPIERLLQCIWDLNDTEAIERIIFDHLFQRYNELLKYLEVLKEKKEK